MCIITLFNSPLSFTKSQAKYSWSLIYYLFPLTPNIVERNASCTPTLYKKPLEDKTNTFYITSKLSQTRCKTNSTLLTTNIVQIWLQKKQSQDIRTDSVFLIAHGSLARVKLHYFANLLYIFAICSGSSFVTYATRYQILYKVPTTPVGAVRNKLPMCMLHWELAIRIVTCIMSCYCWRWMLLCSVIC